MEQHTVNIDGVDTTLKVRGRHDPCVLPRAVPIVEAMAALTILDFYLIDRTKRTFTTDYPDFHKCSELVY